jgi:inner membrane protein
VATIFSHAIAAGALKVAFPAPRVPKRVLVAGAAFAMLPDADVIAFRFGIPYEHVLGHRGLTHSLVFAALLGIAGTWAMFPRQREAVHRGLVALYLSLATASHGLLDALTNGGHGVAFFAPFDNSRHFFPFTPIEVSPIGIARFFSSRGAEVLLSEVLWVWLPAAAFALVAWLFRRARRASS